MIRLRTRLFLAFIAVVLVAVGTMSVFVTRLAETEFDEYDAVAERLQTTRMVQWLLGYHDATNSWAGVQPYVEEMDALTGVAAVVRDAAGEVVADSRGVTADGIVPPSWESHALIPAGAAPVGTLHVSSAQTIIEQFRGRLQRSLWVVMVVGSALGIVTALIVSTAVAAMVSAPIQRIAEAATQAGLGDLTQRVDIRRRDEVGALGVAFNRMVHELGESMQQRRNQIADTAHELRGPLTNISGYLEAIDDGVMDSVTAVPIVRDEVALLIRLVEDLQELALAESGILQIRKRPERLQDLVTHTVSAYQLQAAAEGIDLIVHEAPDLPSVMIDAQRISQVLSNIVGNAVHHTPRGGRIEISCAREGGSVEVRVCDTGGGIPEDELARVFARFRRVDPSRSRATGGSGLGLTIARLLVELHGGEIRARNRPGGGSCFTFTLPASAAAPDD